MKVGDLIEFDEQFYDSMIKAGIPLNKIGIIKEVKEMFYCIQSGTVDDLWVSTPDIKKLYVKRIAL